VSSHNINDDEWHALSGETAEAYKVYSGLRRVMDFKTGITGLKRRVNEQFFRDLLTVESIPGRRDIKPVSRGKFRNILKRLEVVGVITPMPVTGPFVFKLNLATTDQSEKNQVSRAATNATTKQQPEQQPEQNQQKQTTYTSAATKQQPEQKPSNLPSSNQPPVSVLIDRYSRPKQIHDTLKTVIPETWLMRASDRKIMAGWIELGIGSEILNEAVSRALHSKQNSRFGVSYLEPIVRQIKFHADNPRPAKKEKLSFEEHVQKLADEVGLTARPGEPWDAFFQRCKQKRDEKAG